MSMDQNAINVYQNKLLRLNYDCCLCNYCLFNEIYIIQETEEEVHVDRA